MLVVAAAGATRGVVAVVLTEVVRDAGVTKAEAPVDRHRATIRNEEIRTIDLILLFIVYSCMAIFVVLSGGYLC